MLRFEGWRKSPTCVKGKPGGLPHSLLDGLCGEAFAYCAAGAEEADAYGGFGPAVGFRDFLDFVAFEVVTLQNHAVVLLAGFENATDIDACEIDSGRRGEFGKSL
jgi:hypothetical protein